MVFGSIMRLGKKFAGGMRLGGKMLNKVGKFGTKLASGATKAFDAVAGVPIVGAYMAKSPIVQGMRGIAGGIGKVGSIASTAGSILGGDVKSPGEALEKVKRLRQVGKAGAHEVSDLRRRGGELTAQFHGRRGRGDETGTTRHG